MFVHWTMRNSQAKVCMHLSQNPKFPSKHIFKECNGGFWNWKNFVGRCKHRWQDPEIENIKPVIQDLQKMGLCADLVKLCCSVVLLFWKLSLYCVSGLCCNLFCCSLASHVKCLLVCPTCFNKIHVDVMNVICFNLRNYDIEFLLMWWINHEFIYFIFVACATTLLWFWTKTWTFL